MKHKVTHLNVNGTPEQKAQDSIEGLKNNEVRHNEAQPPAAEEINRLVEGVASGTSPTESIQRYKDAVKKALERDYLEFLYAQSMGSWKSWAYAEYLRKELSFTDEYARRIEGEVYKEFGKTADATDWDIFLNGTAEQRKGLQDAIAWEMYGEDPCGDLAPECGKAVEVHDLNPPVDQNSNEPPKDHDVAVRQLHDVRDAFEDHEDSQVVSLECEREQSGH
jgi:hypothetical protein